MVFLLYDTFWDGKNMVSTAALLGIIFNAYKYNVFNAIYLVFTAKNRYNFIKNIKFNFFYFISCLFSVFWWQKTLKHLLELTLVKQ